MNRFGGIGLPFSSFRTCIRRGILSSFVPRHCRSFVLPSDMKERLHRSGSKILEVERSLFPTGNIPSVLTYAESLIQKYPDIYPSQLRNIVSELYYSKKNADPRLNIPSFHLRSYEAFFKISELPPSNMSPEEYMSLLEKALCSTSQGSICVSDYAWLMFDWQKLNNCKLPFDAFDLMKTSPQFKSRFHFENVQIDKKRSLLFICHTQSSKDSTFVSLSEIADAIRRNEFSLG